MLISIPGISFTLQVELRDYAKHSTRLLGADGLVYIPFNF